MERNEGSQRSCIKEIMTSVSLSWAVYYRNLGLSVFPVNGKIPLVPWKPYQQTLPTLEQVTAWWTEYPNASIGLVVGPITGRLILDVDGPTGFNSVKDLPLPATQTVRTRRGVQYHYRWPASLSGKTTVCGILPGVDVRGEGGICIMPPSLCSDNTRYEFHAGKAIGEIDLAEAPEWLLTALVKPLEQKEEIKDAKEANWIEELLDGVGQGERHGAFTKLAGYYFDCMHPDVAAQHLREWNSRNTPPMGDIEAKIKDFSKRIKSGEYDSKFLEKKAAEPKLYSLVSASDLVTKYKNRINWLVEGLIPIASTCILSGYQGLGKTFCATDLITEVSKKQGHGKWLNTFPTKAGPVVYLDNEMSPYLTSYRLQQILRAKNLTTDDLQLHYAPRGRVKLTDPGTYKKLRDDMSQIRPILVVMDSFASCFTLDENSSKEVRYFFDDLIAPLADEFQCAFLFLDHERKGIPGDSSSGNRRLRGSGAKGDSVDTILSLDYKDGLLIMEQSKARYSKRHPPIVIKIEDARNGITVTNGGEFTNETR